MSALVVTSYKSFYPEATNFYQQCAEDKECRRKHQIIDVQLFNGVALSSFLESEATCSFEVGFGVIVVNKLSTVPASSKRQSRISGVINIFDADKRHVGNGVIALSSLHGRI